MAISSHSIPFLAHSYDVIARQNEGEKGCQYFSCDASFLLHDDFNVGISNTPEFQYDFSLDERIFAKYLSADTAVFGAVIENIEVDDDGPCRYRVKFDASCFYI